MRTVFRFVSIVAIVLGWPVVARADFVSGSDGSDGPFNPQFNTIVNLALAVPGQWDTTPGSGNGVYDAAKWAVVFKFTTINVPAGITVRFTNHPSGAPVIWLASGDVTISGTVLLDGADGTTNALPPNFAEPGPGGFQGGVLGGPSGPPAGGLGPGGGHPTSGSQAGHATQGPSNGGAAYGNPRIVPLIGGSGGAGGGGCGGGAGGGAILVASSTQITLNSGSLISAKGGGQGCGGGGGSGGAIRLISDSISGGGQLRALGGNGTSVGRIRIDADSIGLSDLGMPQWTTDFAPAPLFPAATAPTLRIVSVNGVAVPGDPVAGILSTDLAINSGQPVPVVIEATNVPALITVGVRVVPVRSDPISATSSPLQRQPNGTLLATAMVTFPPGKSDIQLRANWTP